MIIEFKRLLGRDYEGTFVEDIYKNVFKYELGGIFNWAIEGLHRLMKQGKFTYNADETYDKWQTSILQKSPLIAFYEVYCDYNDDGKVKKSTIRDMYLTYCQLYKIKPLSDTSFGIKFRKFAKHGETSENVDGIWKHPRTWDGINLKIPNYSNHPIPN